MYDWLEQEISTIKTRRFHVVDGPADSALKAAIATSEIAFPRSYKDFVLRFGNAKLFRGLAGRYYLMGISAPPVRERSLEGEALYCIGHYQSSSTYLKGTLLRGDEETPVFEGFPSRQVQVADSFEAWLVKRYKAARRTYKKQRWSEIVAGPLPFTPDEQRIVEARRRFIWRVVGITPDRNFLLEVQNGSKMLLPFLSIGVRRKGSSPFGGIWLPVSHIHPGQTVVVECDAYKNTADPSEIELFPEPDPEPEDLDRYWEFKALSS